MNIATFGENNWEKLQGIMILGKNNREKQITQTSLS